MAGFSERYRIRIDPDVCQGHSVCMAEAEELFLVEDIGDFYPIARVLTDVIGSDLIEKARTAERYCPNRAITIDDLADDA